MRDIFIDGQQFDEGRETILTGDDISLKINAGNYNLTVKEIRCNTCHISVGRNSELIIESGIINSLKDSSDIHPEGILRLPSNLYDKFKELDWLKEAFKDRIIKYEAT